ncbi:Bor/Iss family lipoprotein [Taibaiella soli]|uniref:Bor family protein n=1 Tax=Taibaiella soli TaxID=1649169 RepID=A0A2W2A9W5_9BACT|nr:hypothetical protein [Taibaiella soli]PZF72185.1 hypothetical protein DN068_14725 [Taibaiella soli]
MYSRGLITTLFLGCCIFLSSCYSYRVATHAQPSTDDIYPNHKKVYSLFWGNVNNPQIIQTPVCDSLGVLGVSEVRFKVGFGNALLSVVTLGIYCPATVYWKCSKPCAITDSL